MNYFFVNLPWWSVWFPRAQTDPTEIWFTRLVFTHHVVATTIFFYCGSWKRKNNRLVFKFKPRPCKSENVHSRLIHIVHLPHFGHSLVLAEIQFDVSESSSHFLIHFLIKWQRTGSCQPSEQEKQKTWPHLKQINNAMKFSLYRKVC